MSKSKDITEPMKEPVWLHTNELDEAIKSLHMLDGLLVKAASDPYYWKWIVIVLHNCFQSFMVCALRGGNGLNVLKPKVRNEWLKAYRTNSDKYPIEKMDTFLNLYKKTQGQEMHMFVHSKNFSPQEEQSRNIRRLNELRNAFVHFLPRKWSLEVRGLPQITKDCVAIITFLVFESGNISAENAQRVQISDAIHKIEVALERIELAYNGSSECPKRKA